MRKNFQFRGWSVIASLIITFLLVQGLPGILSLSFAADETTLLLEQKAADGDVYEMQQLARHYASQGVDGHPRDEVKARVLYEKILERFPSDSSTIETLADFYAQGKGGPKDEVKAAQSYARLLSNDPSYTHIEGKLSELAKTHPEAVKEAKDNAFQKAAAAHHERAAEDKEQLQHHINRAEQGHGNASYEVGDHFAQEFRKTKDPAMREKALHFLKMADEQGHAHEIGGTGHRSPALQIMGDLYSNLYSNEPSSEADLEKAAKYYKKAADKNDDHESSWKLELLRKKNPEAVRKAEEKIAKKNPAVLDHAKHLQDLNDHLVRETTAKEQVLTKLKDLKSQPKSPNKFVGIEIKKAESQLKRHDQHIKAVNTRIKESKTNVTHHGRRTASEDESEESVSE